MNNRYLDIAKHYETCYMKNGDNCKGVDWPNESDARKRYRIMLDIIRFDDKADPGSRYSVMDLGCGLGHMYEYMKTSGFTHDYFGVDISDIFVSECRRKYPDVSFIKMDILKDDLSSLTCKPDYIIMNGVFTEKCSLSYEEMKTYFESFIITAFELCSNGIAFNVMSKDVDWERNDLFHLPLSELSRYLTKELTRKYIIRNDYGLYEYTTYVYK
ncbi:MAG: class I SAM-dependent methyltransferase [Saccharofermentans sp.]|nr:class I SAM-dependent methyltransferase [Saccharofermentans sp.]